MPFISAFDPMTLKSILRVSNYWGKANRNQYPVAFSNALVDMYDWVPCPCNDLCVCKQFSCTHHYIRKANISFKIAKEHFLSCYVDEKIRESVLSGTKQGRGEKAIEAIAYFQTLWQNLQPMKTNLLCTDWCSMEYKNIAKSFKANIDTIYKAKWLSILELDSFVAYDTASFRLLVREYKSRTYFDLISSIRNDLINHLSMNFTSILSFRQYDNPQEYFPDIRTDQYRPIGNIIDKLFLTL